MIGWLIGILYAISALVVYGLLVYYETDSDEGLMIAASMFWPIILIAVIIFGPFLLVEKFVKKLKRMKNLKSVDLKKC